SHRRGTHALQRTRAGVQHVAPAVPRQHHREAVFVQGLSVLRGPAVGDAGAEGEFLEAIVGFTWPPGSGGCGKAAPTSSTTPASSRPIAGTRLASTTSATSTVPSPPRKNCSVCRRSMCDTETLGVGALCSVTFAAARNWAR